MGSISTLEFVSELNSISKTANDGICLFLGAGADISSGGALFADIKKEVVSSIEGRMIHEYESANHIDREFDRVMENLDDSARCMVIDHLIKSTEQWLPSDGYKLLILLAKENCISSVITTNFANLLETSQKQMGVDAFQIYTPATAIPAEYLMKTRMQKAIYLKMHGDIDGRLITHLTSSEINSKSYQDEFVKLFGHLIQNETIVFLGYSGWDTKIAEIFDHNVSKLKSVYWCNICEPDEAAPLIKVFRKNNIKIKYLNYNFDKTLQIIAAEFFKERTLFHVDSIFIWALVKSKIEKLQVDFKNSIEAKAKNIKSIPRIKATTLDDFILDTSKNFCVVSGNSGIGKSFLMQELCNNYVSNEQIWIVPLCEMTTYTDDILDYIAKQLGYTSKDAYTVLYQFSHWACEQDKDFVFVLDNLEEHIGTPKEIAMLINKIIELAYAVRNHPNIKFIVTLRTNIWNTIYQLLDMNYLSPILWNECGDHRNYAVRLDYFDSIELDIARVNIEELSDTSFIPEEINGLIKEPSLYGLIQQNTSLLKNIEELDIHEVFKQTFFNGRNKILLEKLAYYLFSMKVRSYKPAQPISISNIYDRGTDSLRNVLNIEENHIDFKNDLVFECCLSSYFDTAGYIDIFLQYYKNFQQDYLVSDIPAPMYNGIIRYLGGVCNDFGKVVKLIYCLLENNDHPSKPVTKFVNDILRHRAKYDCSNYYMNLKNFDVRRKEFFVLVPYIIHSIGFMQDDYAFQLLNFLLTEGPVSGRLECSALINDRFSIGIQKNSNPQEAEEYFHKYIDYLLIPKKNLHSFFAMLWLAGRIGRDNTSLEIYEVIAALIVNKMKCLRLDLDAEQINEIKNIFLDNAYFIFFNADNDLEEKYCSYAQVAKIKQIIETVRNKRDLAPCDLMFLRSQIDHFGTSIEFFVCNLIFIYMAACDLEYALRNLDALYNTFDDNTSVLELDFYSSALFMSCYVENPFNRQSYVERYDQMIKDFGVKMFDNPSMERLSTCRRFEEKFEIEFEDGFNIFTDYTYTAPMDNYTGKDSKKTNDIYLSTIWELLDTLEQNGMYEDIIRLVQAVNQMSVNWPEEALEALGRFHKYDNPMIRKAVIRTLKENYLRYPTIVSRFLNQTGEAYSEEELLEIYSATDSQIENRALEQLQWARMFYFIKKYLNPNIMDDLMEVFSSSASLSKAFWGLTKSLIG